MLVLDYVIAAVTTIAFVYLVRLSYVVYQQVTRAPESKASYAERLSELISRLGEASAEVDSVLKELATVATDKEKVVHRLEQAIETLNRREGEMQEKIKTLSDVPLPAADYFAEMVSGHERRKMKRDYLLFGAGVVVTTVVGIIIQLVTG